MFRPEIIERMENVLAALAANERDQLQSGLTKSAQETGHALRDAQKVHDALKGAREALTLPSYKTPRNESDLTDEELLAFRDNDPVAATEFREMAALFVQMHEFACDVSQALGLRALRLEATAEGPDDGPSHPPAWWPTEWTEEAVRLMNARSQSLHDNTRAFTRPLRM